MSGASVHTSLTESAEADAPDVQLWVVRNRDRKAESIGESARVQAARALPEKAEALIAAGLLGVQLLAVNPNRERVLARREAENREFAALLRKIRERSA